MLERFTYGKERYLAYITSAFLEHVHRDNVVYHGLAGQFFLKGVSHVLKVRILAEIEDRVALEMEREKLSRDQALSRLRKDDEERRQWSLHLFGVDTWDPSLYDLVLHVHKLRVDDIVRIICESARLEQFKATAESRRVLDNLLLAARVRSRLAHDYPMVQVHAADGVVTIDARFNLTEEPGLANKIKDMAGQTPGVKEVHMRAHPANAYFCDV